MKINGVWRRVAILLITDFMAAAHVTAAPREVHFKLVRDFVIAVPVLVNGRGPYQFVLDTGAESSMIDDQLAAELQIQPLDAVALLSAGGTSISGRAFAKEVAIGSVRVLNSEVLINSLRAIHEVDRTIRGVLGQSFLSHFDYLLDYRHLTLTLQNAPTENNRFSGIKIPFDRRHRAIVTGRTSSNTDLRLVLDSGTSSALVYKTKLASVLTRVSVNKAHLSASGGSRTVESGFISLHLESAWFPNLEVGLVSCPAEPQSDGLLPTRLFSSVYFNNSEGYVMLNPRLEN